MKRRLLVNDMLSALPGHRTFWNDLKDWFDMDFIGTTYDRLAEAVETQSHRASLIVRNASYFGPLKASATVPTISLLQDIMPEGAGRKMQEDVIAYSSAVVFNSAFTELKYESRQRDAIGDHDCVIPLPVDFTTFEPGNPMGLQQALGLPEGCVVWVGACQQAGHVKGFDIFVRVARANPDLPFVAVFKDALPDSIPPNVRCFLRLSHEDLARVMGACRVGLCTSRMETQHLAGIEMGACGLPVVAPSVGVYWKRGDDFPGFVMKDGTEPQHYATAIRLCGAREINRSMVREYWRREFSPEVVRAAWTKLIEEVECSGAS